MSEAKPHSGIELKTISSTVEFAANATRLLCGTS